MEQRQTEIKEGAGLEESRLNTEFIDSLRKWSTPVLMGVAIIAVAYFAWGKYNEHRANKLDTAFQELNDESVSGNPEALIQVAQTHSGQRSVGHLARLEAADRLLGAGVTGLRPGFFVNPQDGTIDEGGSLSDEERADMLVRAEDLYERVVADTRSGGRTFYFTIAGLHGLAAVAESAGEIDRARQYYDEIIEIANANNLPGEAARTEGIAATLEGLADIGNLADVDTLAVMPRALRPQDPTAPGVFDARDFGLPGGTVRMPTPEELERLMGNQNQGEGEGGGGEGEGDTDPLEGPAPKDAPDADGPAAPETPETPDADPDAGTPASEGDAPAEPDGR